MLVTAWLLARHQPFLCIGIARRRSYKCIMLTYLARFFANANPPPPKPTRNKLPVQLLGRCGPRSSTPWPTDSFLWRANWGTQINGFPSRDPRDGFLCLLGPSPAFISYVIGPDWRQHLHSRQVDDAEELYIPRPSPGNSAGDRENERRHCLLMRRCGALIIYSDIDIIERLTATPLDHQAAERQVFGWPEDGGVWILRLPKLPRDCETDEEAWKVFDQNFKDEERQDEVKFQLTRLKKIDDMEEVCGLLAELGGEFYRNPAQCPEVRDLGLWDPK